MICTSANKPVSRSFFTIIHSDVVKYYQSKAVAELINRLEYWFSHPKFSQGFYKFLEPCKHYLYRAGDSWCEELWICRKTFNKLFDRIAVRDVSKTDFLKQDDPFKSKLYASYYDRRLNKMFFVRNHAGVEQLLEELFQGKSGPSPAKSTQSVSVQEQKTQQICKTPKENLEAEDSLNSAISEINKDEADKKIYASSDCRTGTKSQSSYIQRNTNKSSSKQTDPEVQEMQKGGEEMKIIWQEEVGDLPMPTLSLSLTRRMMTFLQHSLQNCLKQWRAYCRKIASSRFLMGEVPNTRFKIWLTWAVNPESWRRIENGEFSLGDRTIASPQPLTVRHDLEAMAQDNIERQPTPQAQAFHRYLLHREGALKYHHWFKDLSLVGTQDQTLLLHAASLGGLIAERFGVLLGQAAAVVDPTVITFKIVQQAPIGAIE